MYLQGTIAEGMRYGAVSPKDYTGLIGWWKASEGVEFSQGSSISKWKDLSGNENHMVPQTSTGGTTDAAGSLVNTSNGLGITRILSARTLVDVNNNIHPYLCDGGAFTIVFVLRTNNLASTANILRPTPQSNKNGIIFSIYQPNGATVPQINNMVYDNTGLKASILTAAPYISPSQGAIYMNVNYGYGSAVVNPYQFLFNNVLKASTAYTSAPVYVSGNPFSFLPNAAIYMYEIIIYNNTGKSVAQIDHEKNTLYNDYILKQYPNLFL